MGNSQLVVRDDDPSHDDDPEEDEKEWKDREIAHPTRKSTILVKRMVGRVLPDRFLRSSSVVFQEGSERKKSDDTLEISDHSGGITNSLMMMGSSSFENGGLVELCTEFISYRRSFYERHEEYTIQFEQRNASCKLLNTREGLITVDIIEMIKSYLPLEDCCSLALTCKLAWFYWFGDQQFWWNRLKGTQIMTHFVKYRPFLWSHIKVRDWKELCLHIKYSCQWKQICRECTVDFSNSESTSVPIYDFYYACKVDKEHEEIQQLTETATSQTLVTLNGMRYKSRFGTLAQDDNLRNTTGATCVLFINVGYNGNGTNAFKIKSMFSTYCDRVRFLILVYNFTKAENHEEVGKSFSHSVNMREIQFWREQSFLFNTPYLEVLEDQRFSINRTQLIAMIKKMHMWNVLTHVGRPKSTEASKMLESFLLSFRQDLKYS
ncbi:hypothetical protein FDP41_003057 [Naegleria fowleri]|uniref:F-box domain-containing protein n=1 Tax=Naegleria fowleri TaxID=5763 RepID=A0A6A5BWP2_NAEFO|nr:uncharacterized protein FDP41_003057 [Naegleria fowleri]KAF0977735.1 hypothetical protein FDP41_003057 [Naegleria fowleri]CAG4708975.1 unnamed protein product [Naegleria fowleri]